MVKIVMNDAALKAHLKAVKKKFEGLMRGHKFSASDSRARIERVIAGFAKESGFTLDRAAMKNAVSHVWTQLHPK